MRESFGKNFLTFFFEVYAHRNQGWDRWSSFHMKGTNWGPIQLSCECSIVFATQKRILQLNILKYLIELCLAGKTKTFNWSKTIFDMIWCSLKCTKKTFRKFPIYKLRKYHIPVHSYFKWETSNWILRPVFESCTK